MKRAFDVIVGSIGLMLSLPLLMAAAVAIKLDSPGPVFFRQVRVGLRGAEFKLLKFRSMVVEAPSLGGHSTLADDPRVTRVGRVLRKTSIDELPQLINVLRGEMSIVGPRPDVPAQRSDYEPHEWTVRTSVKPGITGLAQVHGRSSMTHEERIAFDLDYVSDHRLRRDLMVCVQTLRQLTRGGAI